ARPAQSPTTALAPLEQTPGRPQQDLTGAGETPGQLPEPVEAEAPRPPREEEPRLIPEAMPPTPGTERPANQPVVGEATPKEEAESQPSPALVEENAEAPSKPRSRRRRGGRGRRGRGNSAEASLDESDQDEAGEDEDQPEASAAENLTVTLAPAAPVPAPPPQAQPLEFAETPREPETQFTPEKPALVAEEGPTAPVKIPAKAKAKTSPEPISPEPETPAPSPAPSPRRRRAATEVAEEGEKPFETEGQEAAPPALKAMKELPPALDGPIMTPAAFQVEPSQVSSEPEPEILAERTKAPAPRKAPKPAVGAEPISPDKMAPALDTPPQAKAEEVKVKAPKASEPATSKAPKTPKAPKVEPAASDPKVADQSRGEAGDRN
ncbi:MAG: hypothetical protein WCF05_09715, partial [Chromatiaceae bacterium]